MQQNSCIYLYQSNSQYWLILFVYNLISTLRSDKLGTPSFPHSHKNRPTIVRMHILYWLVHGDISTAQFPRSLFAKTYHSLAYSQHSHTIWTSHLLEQKMFQIYQQKVIPQPKFIMYNHNEPVAVVCKFFSSNMMSFLIVTRSHMHHTSS